ncbi:MAG: DUF4399 domain-containing protein [Actinomycetota bacterium]
MKRNYRLTAFLGAAILLFGACGGGDTETEVSPSPTESAAPPSVAIKSPGEGEVIKGNVVSLSLTPSNIKIVRADGDTSGKSGHFHVFIDRDPVAVGEVIPVEPGIVHSPDNPVLIPGLPVGDHTFKVVLGDGTHKRISTEDVAVKVRVEGPTVDATVTPEDIPTGQEGELNIAVAGVTLVKADADTGAAPQTGHLHILIDPEKAPEANGQPIPPAEENRIFHTIDTKFKLKGLGPGEHSIWVVVGDKTHVPFNPLVADLVKVNIK